MLPDNFDFAQMPPGNYHLREIGMLASSIETIDYAITSWLKEDLGLGATTNEGFVNIPVIWQAPERAYQVKHDPDLRDDAGALKLPLISIERTNIDKDPQRKGSFQANYYSKNRNGRSGRMVISKQIVQDKTRNFAVVGNTRQSNYTSGQFQRHFPRVNKKVVVRSLSIPIPVYVNVDYKIIIKTEYQQQMNELIAPFITRTGQINAFTMKRSGHIYEGFIEKSFRQDNNVSTLDEELRMFTSEINIRVLGYLIGEGENDDRPLVRIDENVVEYVFPSEQAVPEGNPDFFLP